MATQEIINIGTLPNDGEGDPLRVAFGKINNNFSNLFSTTTITLESITVGTTANQVIWETPVSNFTQGQFQIRTGNPDNNDSQAILISAQILNNLTQVKWTGYATTFNGNALATYDMDVSSGNVRILTTPLANAVMQHFIASTVTYVDVVEPSLLLELDGFVAGSVMSTESDLNITTE
jgi:hypothetical protein